MEKKLIYNKEKDFYINKEDNMKIKKEAHEKTIKIIELLKLNNLEVAEILGKDKSTICQKLSKKNDKYYFSKKEYEMIEKHNDLVQLKIKNIDVL